MSIKQPSHEFAGVPVCDLGWRSLHSMKYSVPTVQGKNCLRLPTIVLRPSLPTTLTCIAHRSYCRCDKTSIVLSVHHDCNHHRLPLIERADGCILDWCITVTTRLGAINCYFLPPLAEFEPVSVCSALVCQTHCLTPYTMASVASRPYWLAMIYEAASISTS